MKKFNDVHVAFFVLLFACIALFSCNKESDRLPQDYVGFEHSYRTVEYDRNKTENEIEIKIIAADKVKEDRTVQLSVPATPPGQAPIIKLTENKVILKAGKKSATTIVKVYPKQMVLKEQSIVISCIPQWKKGGISKLTVLLKQSKI